MALGRLSITKSFACVALFCLFISKASAVTMLTLPGSFQPPGISGTYSDDAEFSWIKHRFPSNQNYFSWNFGGGSDGGVIFGQSQAYGELTDEFVMFNQLTAFYSVNTGLNIDTNNTLDMSNLRMQQSGNVIDVGSGSGFNTIVPLVADLSLLGTDENGWSIADDGSFHLFYHTRGTCLDCEMTIHLYGTTQVPVPAAIWLLGSGLLLFLGIPAYRRQNVL